MPAPFSIFNFRSATDPGAPTVSSVAVSGTPTIYSDVWTGEDSDGSGLTVYTTGTLTGTFTRWGTDKPFPDLATDNDWIQDTVFAPTNPAGAPTKFRDDTGNDKARWKRLKYVGASGTGNIQGFVNVTKTSRA